MFTVIIPYHNRAKYLQRTLQSFLCTTVKPDQLILVDNASTDESANICRRFVEQNPDWNIVLLAERRKGACYARNAALSKVETDWVYFFDSDDELSSDYFENVQNKLKIFPDADIVACATQMVFPDGTLKTRAVQHSSSALDQILSGQLATQGMFFRTSFLRRIGGWNETLPKWNDWELGVRSLLNTTQVCWITDKAFHRIYQHADSLTGDDFSSSFSNMFLALRTVASETEDVRKLQLAVASRCEILAAHLFKEKNVQSCMELRNYARTLLRGNCWFKGFLNFIFTYVRIGGRAAWLISKKVLDIAYF